MNATFRTIKELNADRSLDDVQVYWCGSFIQLWRGSEFLTSMHASGDLVSKVVRWLNKNQMRCSQIRDGRIYL